MEEDTQGITQAMPSIDDLKAKYGKIYKVAATVEPDDETTQDFVFVFKKATTASYDRYLKTAANGMSKATQTFLYDNVLDEYRNQLESAINDYPALAISLADKLLTMLGLSKAITLTML